MRVLITGANGFVGSHVVERLQEAGLDIRLLLRKTSRTEFLSNLSAFERIDGELRDPASLRMAVEGVETVVHMGGTIAAANEAEYMAVNGRGTAHLAEAAADAGVRRFVYVSSLSAQGDAEPNEPPRPVSDYGRSKLAGEGPLLGLRERMSVAIIRPPVVYGPRDRALLLAFRAARFGVLPVYDRGLNQLSLVHVTDCADAIVRAALAEGPSGARYTVSDGGTYTWRDLIGVYQKVTGKRVKVLPVPPVVYETAGYAVAYAAFQTARALKRPPTLSPKEIDHLRLRRWVCDYEAIARDLGWKPVIGIEEGMADTLRWYSDHGWL